jgi:hypothetical protein
MGKKILSVVVLILAGYGAWQGIKDIKGMIQKKKAAKVVVPAAKPVV